MLGSNPFSPNLQSLSSLPRPGGVPGGRDGLFSVPGGGLTWLRLLRQLQAAPEWHCGGIAAGNLRFRSIPHRFRIFFVVECPW